MSHPSQESLEDYASGVMKTGARFAVGQHLRHCPACRRTVELLESVGGELLGEGEGEAVSAGAFERVMAALDRPEEPRQALSLDGLVAQGWWVPLWPGLAYKLLGRLADPGEQVYLVRAEPGRRLPHHEHSGREWLMVLEGGFKDCNGRYKAGDLIESDPETAHQPIAIRGDTCLCLIVTHGPMRPNGFFSRLLQPLLGY